MFKNLELFSLSVLKQNLGYQSWNSKNACQNSKQGDPDQEQSDRGLHCLCKHFWQATSFQFFLAATIYSKI